MARKHLSRLVALVCVVGSLFIGCGGGTGSVMIFELLIENVSGADTLTASDGSSVTIAFSPVVWAIHSQSGPMYTLGQPAPDNGLEAMAEDADPGTLIDFLTLAPGVSLVGLARTTVEEQSVLTPGQTYRFQISADRGTRMSFISTFLQGNDIFVGFSDAGIPLFDAQGTPLSGDITSEVFLLDAGTEVNQEPGLGPDQVLRQEEPGQGADEGGVVHMVDDGFAYPAISSMLRVTINPVREVSSN